MFCGKCGYKLEDIDKFCPQCGAETQVYRDLMEAVEPAPERPAENRLEIECVSMSVKPDKNYRVDPNERHELVFLTRDEAVEGCRKVIEVNGAKIAIDVPPNYKAEKAMIIKGYGHMNEETGERGNLKVQFLID